MLNKFSINFTPFKLTDNDETQPNSILTESQWWTIILKNNPAH
jgi:hypothetical protein